MGTSAEFDLIQLAIESTTTLKAIQATWLTDGKQYTLWPLVLGFSQAGGSGPDPEKVLCYKFDPTNTNARRFRCYKVADLTSVVRVDWPTTPSPPPIQEPRGLRFKQVVSQNCVTEVECFRRFK
jgi:hypothetical protein